MTSSEFKLNVAESENREWLNNIEVSFKYSQFNISVPLKGITAIYEYIDQQINGWIGHGDPIPQEFANIKMHLEKLQPQIIQLLHSPGSSLNTSWINISKGINRMNSPIPFPYDIPETHFIINLFRKDSNLYNGAYLFITDQVAEIFTKKRYITGALMAYEFTASGESEITKRRHAEKESLRKNRNDFYKYLDESEKLLSDHLAGATNNYNEHLAEFKKFQTDREAQFDNWLADSQKTTDKVQKDYKDKIKELENTYEELLRLKEPADYWKKRAVELNEKGLYSLYGLAGLTILTCVALYALLWLTPEGMLKTFFNNDRTLAIRWSIIFITFISFIAVGVRALMKVMFSYFHLARDAEERERLTYVYLAMIKDKSIDKDDRQLVMQSLFSRADTGLLKEDSSPSMPGIGSLVDKVNIR